MPAIEADIFAVSREAAEVNWFSAAISARYPSARDGTLQVAEGYFDSATDAQTVINARGALIGVERRRFTVPAHDTLWPSVATGVPTIGLVDVEQAVNATFIAARVEIDLEAETTNFELFG